MKALLAAILASVIWGMNPLFFSRLNHVPVLELLAHRILWAAVFVGLFCVLTGRMTRLRAALVDGHALGGLLVTALLITVNWGFFVMAVQAGRVAEAGVGYYLMPLISVALGVSVLGERLTRAQGAAVALAVVAVAILGIGIGAAPWLPVLLAATFSVYGLMRKRMKTGAIVGFEVEALLLTPLALGWLLVQPIMGWSALSDSPGGWFGTDLWHSVMLMLGGLITGVPLILFAEAARRMSYSAASLALYVNPTLQVASATLILGEAVNGYYLTALAMIWISLAIYSREALRAEKAARTASSAPSASRTTVR